jgi:hypothetical protein
MKGPDDAIIKSPMKMAALIGLTTLMACGAGKGERGLSWNWKVKEALLVNADLEIDGSFTIAGKR